MTECFTLFVYVCMSKCSFCLEASEKKWSIMLVTAPLANLPGADYIK